MELAWETTGGYHAAGTPTVPRRTRYSKLA
jgi:hypothetical protein